MIERVWDAEGRICHGCMLRVGQLLQLARNPSSIFPQALGQAVTLQFLISSPCMGVAPA